MGGGGGGGENEVGNIWMPAADGRGRDERSTDRAAMVCEKRVNSTKALGGRGHGNFLPSSDIVEIFPALRLSRKRGVDSNISKCRRLHLLYQLRFRFVILNNLRKQTKKACHCIAKQAPQLHIAQL